jgi:hypothetical protein
MLIIPCSFAFASFLAASFIAFFYSRTSIWRFSHLNLLLFTFQYIASRTSLCFFSHFSKLLLISDSVSSIVYRNYFWFFSLCNFIHLSVATTTLINCFSNIYLLFFHLSLLLRAFLSITFRISLLLLASLWVVSLVVFNYFLVLSIISQIDLTCFSHVFHFLLHLFQSLLPPLSIASYIS